MAIVKKILFVFELLICYGTIASLLFAGYFYVPFYLGIVIDYLASPESYPNASIGVLDMFKPLMLLIGGTFGFIALIKMLFDIFTEGSRESGTRLWPIGFFIIGNVTLLFLIKFIINMFGHIGVTLEISFYKYFIILLPYVILPLIANAHIFVLYLSKHKKMRNVCLEEY